VRPEKAAAGDVCPDAEKDDSEHIQAGGCRKSYRHFTLSGAVKNEREEASCQKLAFFDGLLGQNASKDSDSIENQE
jgi:hypothetical protein